MFGNRNAMKLVRSIIEIINFLSYLNYIIIEIKALIKIKQLKSLIALKSWHLKKLRIVEFLGSFSDCLVT